MTQSPQPPNYGNDFATNQQLFSADVNQVVHNEELAWANSAGGFSPVVQFSSGNDHILPISYLGDLLSISHPISGGPFVIMSVSVSGATFPAVPTGLSLQTGAMVYNEQDNAFYVYASQPTTTNYASGDLITWSAAARLSVALGAYSAVTLTSATRRHAVVGTDLSTSYGRIAVFNGNVEMTSTLTSKAGLTDIASNGAGTAVAVATDGFVYTTSNGASWTAGNWPSMSGTMSGNLSVSWSPTLSLFIASVQLTTGAVAWTVSPAGSIWQPWRKTPVVISGDANFGAGYRTAGICAVGGVLVCPVISSAPCKIGVAVSADSGASWRIVFGGEYAGPNFDRLKAVTVGNRAAIASKDCVTITLPLVGNDKINSVLA